MSKEKPVYASAVTHEFLKEIIADSNKPILGMAKKDIRGLNMTGVYFGSRASHWEIGVTYGGITGERVRQIVERTMKNLWHLSSENTKRQFPLDSIQLRKPFDKEIRKRISKGRGGGVAARALDLLEEGKTPEEILEELNLPVHKASELKGLMRRWGHEVPRLTRDNRDLSRQLQKARADEEIKEIFSRIGTSFRQNQVGPEPERLLFAVKNLTDNLYVSNQGIELVVLSLRNAGVPVGEVVSGRRDATYYFIAKQHLSRAREVLLNDETLDRFRSNPVIQVAGFEETTAPRVRDIYKKGAYVSLRMVYTQIGFVFWHWKRDGLLGDLGSKCPVPIFRHQGQYWVKSDDQDKLQKYLKEEFRKREARRK
jgi:hypothetical protein